MIGASGGPSLNVDEQSHRTDRPLRRAGNRRSITQARRLAVVSDIALAAVVLALGVLRDLDRLPGIRDPERVAAAPHFVELPGTWLLAAQVLGAVALLGRRRNPYVVGLLLAAMAVVAPVLAALVMPYSVARHGRGVREVLLVNAAIVAGLITGGRLWQLVGTTDWRLGDPYSLVLVVIALTATGLYLRTRGELLADLADRAESAEYEAGLLADRARLRERVRLAGELHDVVTHWVTLMTLQSGALSVTTSDEHVRREADEVRQTGTRALRELHTLIRLLRSEEDAAPAANARTRRARLASTLTGEATLQQEVAARAAGRRVELIERGETASVSPVIDEALRYIVGESLVNAAKHAPGAPVFVEVTYGDDDVVATIVNGRATSSPREQEGSGLGLVAIRRRSELVGGAVDAAPTSDGGYRVEVRLPRVPHEDRVGVADKPSVVAT